jgi:hypothetical protein
MDKDPEKIRTVPNDYNKYNPLSISEKEIRVAHIRPLRYGQNIVCTLQNISLEHKFRPEYECLSYCWGSLDDTEQITLEHTPRIDGETKLTQLFNITRSLGHAIRAYRAENDEKVIWIDALCINQGDILERTHQVREMRAIYSGATRVYVWLGEENKEDNLGVDFIAGITVTAVGRDDLALVASPEGLISPWPIIDVPDDHPSEGPTITQRLVCSLSFFFNRPWFRRVWVLQEVANAATTLVMCGQTRLRWGHVLLVAKYHHSRNTVHNAYVVPKYPDRVNGFLPQVWVDLAERGRARLMPFMELMFAARELHATDPRDKLYALLGLAKEIQEDREFSLQIWPDYTKTQVQVSADFTKEWICRYRTLGLLSAVDTFSLEREDRIIGSEISSWLPSFESEIKYRRILDCKVCYRASLDTLASPQSILRGTQGILNLEGARVDRVAIMTSDMQVGGETLKLFVASAGVDGAEGRGVVYLWSIVRQFTTYPKKHRLWSFILTLTGGFARRAKEYPDRWEGLGNVQSQYPPDKENLALLFQDFIAYWKMFAIGLEQFTMDDLGAWYYDRQLRGSPFAFKTQICRLCFQRSFFTTQSGRMGLCPRQTRPGDLVVVLYGGNVPYILRPLPGLNSSSGRVDRMPFFKFVGECYVHGMMDGEAIIEQKRYHVPTELFPLV